MKDDVWPGDAREGVRADAFFDPHGIDLVTHRGIAAGHVHKGECRRDNFGQVALQCLAFPFGQSRDKGLAGSAILAAQVGLIHAVTLSG